ncbi:MAG: DUF1289 domain-containing protein [Gammaproteobacteria bacterium]|nr:DUF1289 domain-containing protein [Gammaproteobacteria bacterium]
MPATKPITVQGKRDDSANPCVGVCSTGLGDEICRGCGRSFHEVTHWASFSAEQRRAINLRIRLQRVKAECLTETSCYES